MSDALHDHRGRLNNCRAHCRAASSGPQQRPPATRAGVNRRHERRTPGPGRGVAGTRRPHGVTQHGSQRRSPAAGAGHGSPHEGAHPSRARETRVDPAAGQSPGRCRGFDTAGSTFRFHTPLLRSARCCISQHVLDQASRPPEHPDQDGPIRECLAGRMHLQFLRRMPPAVSCK
jgi:hypothetical protein